MIQGTVKSVEGVPFEDEFKLKRRLFDPRPFALDEWTDNAVALYDDEEEDIPPNTDTYTLLLYPVISPRFKALLETTLSPTEVEFLPVHLVGKTTQQPRGAYYLPHCLQAHDCIDHQRLKYSFQVRLFHDRIPPNARLFIAPDPVHNRLVFRDELVNYIRNAGIIGIDFYQLETDAEAAEKETVPLGLLFFASPDEQHQWLQQALAEGAYATLVWQRWHTGGDRIATQIAHLRTPDDTRKVPWVLSAADAEATLTLSVYLSRPEWQDRLELTVPEGELESGGFGEWLELGRWTRPVRGGMVGWMWAGVSGDVLVRAELVVAVGVGGCVGGGVSGVVRVVGGIGGIG
jgi:hypothetical protein